MTMKTVAVVALVAVLSASAMTLVDAQGRAGGGRAGGGRGAGPGAPGAGPRTGTIDRIVVHGRSLEKNLEGDSADREVLVYLPPSYAAEPARRFPTVYLLHGYGGRENTFTESLGNLAASANRLDGAQGFSSAIYVMPNAFTLHKGSMYSSSVTTGDWERFIAEDLVAHIDGRYRTLPARMSRGLAGHSMGGYGAIRIGMKRSDVFASLYLMSACCVTPGSNPAPASLGPSEAVKTREQAEEAARAPGFGPSLGLALAAAWSPNPANPPLFLDLPVNEGKVRPEIVAKWAANAPTEMLGKHVENLNLYYAIAVDIGLKDQLLAPNRELHAAMTRLRIPHTYEEYDGDHTNKVGERLERNVLPFFARNLVAPSNPTSPSPEADRLTPAPR